MAKSYPMPNFDEIQIRAMCPYPHEEQQGMCLECDDTEYINRWVKIDDLLGQVTLDNSPVNLQWRSPIINED